MAQKRDKEETELKLPNKIRIRSPPQQKLPISPLQLPAVRSAAEISDPTVRIEDPRTSSADSAVDPAASNRKRPREVNRCSGSGCRKRVGLMGFKCRCGDVFCSEHRYSDRHECGYDYKAAGREAIQRENPVVRAAKLVKV